MVKKTWINTGEGCGYWNVSNSYGDEINCDDSGELKDAIKELENKEKEYQKDLYADNRRG